MDHQPVHNQRYNHHHHHHHDHRNPFVTYYDGVYSEWLPMIGAMISFIIIIKFLLRHKISKLFSSLSLSPYRLLPSSNDHQRSNKTSQSLSLLLSSLWPLSVNNGSNNHSIIKPRTLINLAYRFILLAHHINGCFASPSSSTTTTTTTRPNVTLAVGGEVVKPSKLFAPSSRLKASCGFPGNPKHGRVMHALERYEEGMVVAYECDDGYYLLGPMTRTCLSNGTWSGAEMPVCDRPIKKLGLSSASEALNNYPPQLAIDGNSRTCFFSNRRKPRWWRVELPRSSVQNKSITYVALTLPPINAELFFSIYVIEIETLPTIANDPGSNETEPMSETATNSKYHKCATFRGVFSSKTIFVQCPIGGDGSLRGHYLQIEDDYPQLEYFGLCEVEIFIERSQHECGQIESPAYGFVMDSVTEAGSVKEYFCHEGYRLIGESRRTCHTPTGQWIGKEPFCERIVCPDPTPISNGFLRMYGDYYETPVVGTRAVYECRPGFAFVENTNDTRVCDHRGQWTGFVPDCEAIDCGHPESFLVNSEDFMIAGGRFHLINESTRFSALAELLCPNLLDLNQLVRLGANQTNASRLALPLFRCREDGIWTEISVLLSGEISNETATNNSPNNNRPVLNCLRQRQNGFFYFYGHKNMANGMMLRKSFYFRETSVNMLHLLAGVVCSAFLSILVIVILLFKRNIIEWPEQTSCQAPAIFLKWLGSQIVKVLYGIFQRIECFFNQRLSCCRKGDSSTTTAPKTTADSTSPTSTTTRSKSNQQPLFTIVASGSSASTSDIEIGRNGSCEEESHLENQQNPELNTALATFYEEITSAAKQMFSEETDRKLLRAARIAAELDAIKQQQQQQNYDPYYQWSIYSTTPRFQQTSSSLPPSLSPSVHEYHQIPSNSQVYAKIDLIRKHRYRKEREEMISVYQVPKPQNSPNNTTNSLNPRHHHLPSNSNHNDYYYRLRKAISTPDTVYTVIDDGGQYGSIINRRLWAQNLLEQNIRPCGDEAYSSILSTLRRNSQKIHEPINQNQLKTLL